MSERLENKVVIITGALRGIGKEAASLFADEGASLVLVDINVKEGYHLTSQLVKNGAKAIFVETDHTDKQQVIPRGSMAAPNEIAQIALFLISDESSYITRTAIPADGGYTAE